MNNLFPIFVKLEELTTLIVGGGEIGIEKLHTVIKNSPDANVILVAKEISPEIKIYAVGKPNIKLREKAFEESDLKNIDIVIAATFDHSLNLLIWQKAKQNRVLINAADMPKLCDFYLGSVVQKDDLKIAISSNGKSPMLTKRIRQYLESALPESTTEMIENLSAIRQQLNGDFRYRLDKLKEVTSSFLS